MKLAMPTLTKTKGLSRVLEELELHSDPADVRSRLYELLHLLVDEFANEQARVGVLDVVSGGVRQLDRRHQQLLNDIADLLINIADLLKNCDECLEHLTRVKQVRQALASRVRPSQTLGEGFSEGIAPDPVTPLESGWEY